MRCNKCGADNQLNSKYCEKCGAKLEVTMSETGSSQIAQKQKKQGASKKLAGIFIVCVLAVLVCVGGYFVLFKDTDGNTNDTSLVQGSEDASLNEQMTEQDTEDESEKVPVIETGKFSFSKAYLMPIGGYLKGDDTRNWKLIYNGKILDNKKYRYQQYEWWNETQGYYAYSDNLYHSVDGTVNCVYEEDNKQLYIVNKEKPIENVERFLVSESGNFLVYESGGGVFLYDVQTENTTEIVKNGEFLVISPNGKSVIYSTVDGVYLYSNQDVSYIGNTDMDIIGFSDSAKHIYYYKDKSLYIYNGITNKEQLISDNGVTELSFNVSNTQISFRDHENNWYITNENNEKIFITSDIAHSLSLLKPEFASAVKSFFEQFYYDDTNKSLFYVDKSGQIHLIADRVNEAKINRDGNTVYILKDHELFFVKESDLSNIVSVTEGVRDFIITFDNAVYYTDSSNILWYKEGEKAAVQIAEDVDTDNSESQIVITHDNYVLFLANPVTLENDKYIETCMLYYSKDGSEKGLVADNVTSVVAVAGTTYYFSDPERQQITGTTSTDLFKDLYFSLEDMEFKRVNED